MYLRETKSDGLSVNLKMLSTINNAVLFPHDDKITIFPLSHVHTAVHTFIDRINYPKFMEHYADSL